MSRPLSPEDHSLVEQALNLLMDTDDYQKNRENLDCLITSGTDCLQRRLNGEEWV